MVTIALSPIIAPTSSPASLAALKGPSKAASSAVVGHSPSLGDRPGLATIDGHLGQDGTLNPTAAVPGAPPPSLSGAPALSPHEVFGFAPYWTLADAAGFDVRDLSTIAYFGVDVTADGSISTSGPGWAGLHSAQLVALVDRAHAAGDRVVLTAECLDPATLVRVLADPSAPARLAGQLAHLVAAESMDGVNLDFEGVGSAGSAGLVRLVSEVSAHLRAVDPHWQITMDTYGSSAAGGAGRFFDIPALAPSVDAFFVMAYDMGSLTAVSPNAPLSGPGWTDQDVVDSYTAVVAPSKVILGIPFYGYAWTTTSDILGSEALSGASPMSYAQLASYPTYWDQSASSPWTAWQQGGQWHQAFFDGPTSVALKARLASEAGLRGVGVWALGMAGDDAAMMDALLGHAPALKDWVASPEPSVGTDLAAGVPSSSSTSSTLPPPASSVPAAATIPPTSAPPPATGPALCDLLGGDQQLGSALKSLAAPGPADPAAELAGMAAALGCGGKQRAAALPTGLCSVLTAQAGVAADLQGAAAAQGTPAGADLASLIQEIAARAGCPGVVPPGSAAAGSTCAALASFLSGTAHLGQVMGADDGGLEAFAWAGSCGPGRLAAATTSSSTTSSSTTSSTTSPTTPPSSTTAKASSTTTSSSTTSSSVGAGGAPQMPSGLCAALGQLAAAQGGLQQAVADELGHPLAVDLGKVVTGMATATGCGGQP